MSYLDIKQLQSLKSHNSDVTSCDFGGNFHLASCSGDKSVCVYEWKVSLGYVEVPYSPLLGHKYGVTCVRFSPQGTMLASASIDGSTVLWNVQTGVRIHTFIQTSGGAVRICRFAPDSTLLVTAGDDGSVCIWNLIHRNLLRTFQQHEGTIQAVSFTPDSCCFTTGCSLGVMKLWHVKDSDDENSLVSLDDVHDLGIMSSDFLPIQEVAEDGEQLFRKYILATCGNDHLVKIWSVYVGKKLKHISSTPASISLVRVLTGHSSGVTCVRYSPTGAYLASTGLDKTCHIWDFDGNCLTILDGHLRYIACCAFSRDGNLLATGSNDKTLILWNVGGNWDLDSELVKPCSALRHYANSKEEDIHLEEQEVVNLAERDKNEVKLLQRLDKPEGDLNSCHFFGNDLFASGCGDNLIYVWSRTEEGRFEELDVSPLEGHQYAVHQVEFSPSGTLLASCSLDGTAVLWDVTTGKSASPNIRCNGSSIRTCRFSPDGHLLVTAGDDEKAMVWNVNSMECVMICEGHRDSIVEVAFTPDSQFLVSACSDGNFKLWCLMPCSDECIMTQEGAHDLGVQSCDFSPFEGTEGWSSGILGNSYLLATCGLDSLIKLWTISSSANCNLWKQLAGHGGVIMCVRFSPTSGEIMASAASDRTARLWNVYTGECLHVLESHNSMVLTCAFSSDSRLFATGSLDKNVIIWEIPHGTVFDAHASELLVTERIRKHRKKLLDWSVDDIKNWLCEIHLSDVIEAVSQHQLTGQHLLTMSAEVLLDMLQIDDEEEQQKLRMYLFWLKKADQGIMETPSDCDIPHEFLCPITHELMQDPVICSDGFTYECAAINEWFLSGKFTSPMTNSPLTSTKCIPNSKLRTAIYQYLYGETVS